MAYSDFTLDELLEKFDLAIEDIPGLFTGIEAKEANAYLRQTLEQNLDLAIAINTEKARSEMIIAPILLEVRRRDAQHLSLFSGVEFNSHLAPVHKYLIRSIKAINSNTETVTSYHCCLLPVACCLPSQVSFQLSARSKFNVDRAQGLNGICDFILSQSPEQLLIRSPVVTIVEAKNENLKSGFAQCIAAMVGAQIFNARKQNPIQTIYGVVTIGTIWRFIQLQDKKVQIDLKEYYIDNLDQILGILYFFAEPQELRIEN
ncbi:MAG: hypothetical protein F6K31_15635 [Symploca sp. SIO2G7]|nr:hypothetical protein [Symploca sp. SIO2G7]